MVWEMFFGLRLESLIEITHVHKYEVLKETKSSEAKLLIVNKLLQRVVEQLQLNLISLAGHSFGDLVGQILDGSLEVTGLGDSLIPETDSFLGLVTSLVLVLLDTSGTGVDLVLLKRVGVNLHLLSLVDSLKRVGVNLNLLNLVLVLLDMSGTGVDLVLLKRFGVNLHLLNLADSEAGILGLVASEAGNHLWISSMNLVAQSESFLINDTKSNT
jgi:hypothetical protein